MFALSQGTVSIRAMPSGIYHGISWEEESRRLRERKRIEVVEILLVGYLVCTSYRQALSDLAGGSSSASPVIRHRRGRGRGSFFLDCIPIPDLFDIFRCIQVDAEACRKKGYYCMLVVGR